MNLEILSGAPLLAMDDVDVLAAVARGEQVPAGIPRATRSRHMIEKQNIFFPTGEANGQKTQQALQFQANYKRLVGISLYNRQLNPADTYEVQLQLSDGTVINMIDQGFLSINPQTPVMDRWTRLDRRIEQSNVTLIINVLGAAGGGTQLTGDINAQIAYLLATE